MKETERPSGAFGGKRIQNGWYNSMALTVAERNGLFT